MEILKVCVFLRKENIWKMSTRSDFNEDMVVGKVQVMGKNGIQLAINEHLPNSSMYEEPRL